MFLSRIDTSARHIIISGHFCSEKSFFKNVWTILRKCVMCMKHLTLNEDSNKIFWFWKIFFSRKNIFGCGDRSTFANQNWRWLRKSKWDTDTDDDCRPGAGDRVHTVQPQSGLQAINQSQVVTHEKYDRSKWTQMDAAQRRGPTTSSSS